MTESDRLEEEYSAEFDRWDWASLKRDCIQSAIALQTEAEKDSSLGEYLDLDGTRENGQIIGSVYLGSIFNMSPSGKYYMPFACSNVEACPYCHGSGHSPEVEQCRICHGQGSRSLSELARLRHETVQQATKILAETFDEPLGGDTFRCNYCHGATVVKVECEYCGGIGSQEAYQDMVWGEILDTVADKYNMWVGSGEGCATDLFAFYWVDLNQVNLIRTVKEFLARKAGYRDLKQAIEVF